MGCWRWRRRYRGQRRFCGVGREEAGVIAIFVVRQRIKPGLANSNSRAFPDHHLRKGSSPDCWCPDRTRWIGIFHRAAACGPRICTHQPLLTKLFTILDAKENAALVQRYFRGPGLHLLDIVEAAHRHGVRTVRQTDPARAHHQADVGHRRFSRNAFQRIYSARSK